MKLIGKAPARPEAVLQGKKYRISVLTEELFRLEYAEDGIFVDEKSQTVIDRDFEVPAFEVKETEEELVITTAKAELYYNKKEFTKNGLSIRVRGNGCNSTWHYSIPSDNNLKGTARTLDCADGDNLINDLGPLQMEEGIFADRDGFAVLDDSKIALVEENEDGMLDIHPRTGENLDLYFFGYGYNYEKGLKDYYHLTGKTPLIPRFALGNWWSRYHRYTAEEYEELILRFEEEKLPLSVAVIDMDWHLVDDVDPKYGSGWTGYTWNPEFFPDYKAFLNFLHEHGLKTALNIHPADGVRGFEAMYKEMAAALGKDVENEEPIAFDIVDHKYVKAENDYIFHPYEEDGVDFWWLDWQQGGVTKVPGLDPLWMLNHYHYQDNCRDGKRGLTFSRYAGPGSHRYPIGFSGDTLVTWESLDFQPYFTATASNIGYGWWSHDIGGHMMGYKDEELTVRWIQLGVFSPIMRLHTSDCEFMHKEPWYLGDAEQIVVGDYMRLRHALLPYLYTMNVRASRDSMPLVQPLYYKNPGWRIFRNFKNEFYFGSELLVSPITTPKEDGVYSCVNTYIPAGDWYDIFNGRHYTGGKALNLYRTLKNIPVLAKGGAILPMTDMEQYTSSVENPKALEIRVFPGAEGSFTMMEDNGLGTEYVDANWAKTPMKLEILDADKQTYRFVVSPAEGNLSCIPAERSVKIVLYGIPNREAAKRISVAGMNVTAKYNPDKRTATLCIPAQSVTKEIEVLFESAKVVNDLYRDMSEVLSRAEMSNLLKTDFERTLKGNFTPNILLSEAMSMEISETVRGAIAEVVLAEER